MKVCVLGLGRTGQRVIRDLIAADLEVSAYDPVEIEAPSEVAVYRYPAIAVAKCDLVIAATGVEFAKVAMLQVLEALAGSAIYVDLSASAPGVKAEMEQLLTDRGVGFADVAYVGQELASSGLAGNCYISGHAAKRCAEILNGFGATAEVIEGTVGSASGRRLMQSLIRNGFAALVLEVVQACDVAGDLEWLWQTLSQELAALDASWLSELIEDTKSQPLLKAAETSNAIDMLLQLGIKPIVSAATVSSLKELSELNTAEFP